MGLVLLSQLSPPTLISFSSLSPSKLPSSSLESSPALSLHPSLLPPPTATASCSAYSFFLPSSFLLTRVASVVKPSPFAFLIVPFPHSLRSARAPIYYAHLPSPPLHSRSGCLLACSPPPTNPSVSVHLERIMALRVAVESCGE